MNVWIHTLADSSLEKHEPKDWHHLFDKRGVLRASYDIEPGQ